MPQTPTDTERTTLVNYFDEQREHALGILDGLDDEALRRPVLPSGWSCLGAIQHLKELERFWFGAVVTGNRAVIDTLSDVSTDWLAGPEVPVADVFDAYREEIARSNAGIVATPLEAAPAWWPGDLFGDWRLHNVRQIVLHALTETACHAGHLDAARELLDGRLWLVL